MNIYPSYKCNMSCSFCGIHKLEGNIIDLNWIYEQLLEHPILRSNKYLYRVIWRKTLLYN